MQKLALGLIIISFLSFSCKKKSSTSSSVPTTPVAPAITINKVRFQMNYIQTYKPANLDPNFCFVSVSGNAISNSARSINLYPNRNIDTTFDVPSNITTNALYFAFLVGSITIPGQNNYSANVQYNVNLYVNGSLVNNYPNQWLGNWYPNTSTSVFKVSYN